MAARHRHRLAHIPVLDGIRGVAVVCVLLYHGGVSWMSGGFLGVDVFLVLSGFLITTLLWAEWEATGTISLVAFWGRRARRLFPALIVVLVAVALYGALLADPSELARLRGDVVGTVLYVANWRLIVSGQSYFEQFATPSPLRHAWSLGIEEQWYLIWPVLVLAALRAWRGRRTALVVSVTIATVASAGLMAVLVDSRGGDLSRAYYGTDTRAQALLVGALLALVTAGRRAGSTAPSRASRVAATTGAACLAILVLTVDDGDRWLYRGGFAFAAICTAAVIAGCLRPEPGRLGSVLASRPLRLVGRVSYGAYLWHWPVYVVLSTPRTGLTGPALLGLRLVVTAVLCTASYVLLEQPVQRGTLTRPRLLVAPAAGLAGLVGLFVVPLPVADDPQLTSAGASVLPVGDVQPAARRVLVVGDSVARTLGEPGDVAVAAGPLVTRNAATLGCGIVGRLENPVCASWPDRWQKAVDGFQPDVAVLLVGAWEVLDAEVDGRHLPFGSAGHQREFRQQLDRAITILSSGGARVVLLTAPCYRPEPLTLTGGAPGRDDPDRVALLNRLVVEVARGHPARVDVVDLHGFVCGHDGGIPEDPRLRYDGVHFTAAGAESVWEWLAPQLAITPGRLPALGATAATAD